MMERRENFETPKTNPIHPFTGKVITNEEFQPIKDKLKNLSLPELHLQALETETLLQEFFNIDVNDISEKAEGTLESETTRKNVLILDMHVLSLIEEELKRRSQNN